MIDIHDEAVQAEVKGAASALSAICHGLARQSGWWKRDPDLERLIALAEENGLKGAMDKLLSLYTPVRLMLMVSELGEAMEAHRKGRMDDHIPHRRGVEVELADALIRIFDQAGGEGYDVAGAMAEKLAFNAKRADHRPEERAKAGGKTY